jgi:hypothetical protein
MKIYRLWLTSLFFSNLVGFCCPIQATLLYLNEFNLSADPRFFEKENSQFAYRIFSLNAGVYNNSFTLSQYNRFSGAFLSESTKGEILASIPSQGFRLQAGANLSGLDIVFNNFGLSIFLNGSLACRVPKDVFDLTLYGNQMNRRYEASDLKVRDILFFAPSISYYLGIKRRLNIGGRVRYLGGIYYFETLQTQGYLITTPSFLVSEGNATYRLGRGGSGIGFDLGIGYDFSCNLRATLALINLNSGINWTNNPECGTLNFALDSINFERIRRGDFFQKSSQVTQTAPFRTPLPFYINVGTCYQINPILISRFLLSQSFNESEITRRAPMFTATVEFRGFCIRQFMLPIEIGASLGGKEGFGFGYSLGIIIKKFAGYFAVKDLGGLFLGAKGTTVFCTFGYNLNPPIKKKPDTLFI